MTGTRFCDSTGFGVLVRAHRQALAEGGGLRLPRARSARSRRSCSDSAATMSSTKPATDREPACSAWRSTAGSADSAKAVRVQYAQTTFCPAW
jgi:hypothetical protein